MSEDSYEVNPTQLTSGQNAPMPHNEEAEQSILAAMIGSEDILDECLAELEDSDFFTPSNRTLLAAMRQMRERGMPVDIISLADMLHSSGQTNMDEWRRRLIDLGNNPLAQVGWHNHVEMVKRDATLRRMIIASAQISALAYNAPEDTREVVERAEKMLLEVTDRSVRSAAEPIDVIMETLFNELEALSATNSAPLGVNTGFRALDKYLLGLRPGQMMVVGARPGVGKTAFALNLALNAASSGVDESKGASVAFFSLEMSKQEIAQRLLASEATSITLQNIRSGKIPNEAWPDLITATERLSRLDIQIDDTPGTTVTEIRTKARRMLRGKENGIIIVDYLQLLSAPSNGRRNDSRANEVSEMSRGIKIMAKELGVPVVALSQLNRDVESRSGGRGEGSKSKRPQLSDLRESGSIEQDADIVVLLDRSTTEEEAARPDRPDMGITDFIIAKNRSGGLGVVSLAFRPDRTKFMDLDRFHDE